MASRAGISGVAVAVVATGALLIVSGVRDAPVLDALRDIMQGRNPQGRAPEPSRIGSRTARAGAVGQAIGEAVGRTAAGLIRPVGGQITSGWRTSSRPTHKGVDIPMPSGTPVLAAAAGKVANTGFEPFGAGNFVQIQHSGGLKTKYFHLSKISVSKGASVAAGAQVGLVGSTGKSSGPHLHFEVWLNGKDQNPANYI